MICIFCEQDSDKSRSVEHIIPESLGNTKLRLPPGVVCDQCNNYFARKVEKPLLDSAALLTLRFHQSIPSKRRRIPPLDGIIQSGESVTMHRFLEGAPTVDVTPEGFATLMSQKRSTLILPGTSDEWPEDFASRFLAKAALEYMAFKLVEYPEGLEYVATESQLDPIRTFARRGGGHGWPYHVRRLYDIEKAWIEPDGEVVQRVYECDSSIHPKVSTTLLWPSSAWRWPSTMADRIPADTWSG